MRTGLAIDKDVCPCTPELWTHLGGCQADFAVQAAQINVHFTKFLRGLHHGLTWKLKEADIPYFPRGYFHEQSVPWGPVISGSSWNALGIFLHSQSKSPLASKQMWAVRVL